MNIILFGASGKMGQVTAKYIEENFKDFRLVQVSFSKKKTEENKALTFYDNLKIKAKQKKTVVIDFSNKDCLRKVIGFCKKNKLPLVSAVTGYGDKDFAELKQSSKTIPIMWSSNFSEGVSAIKKILGDKKLKKFKFSIIESHHKHKKDMPSGTAKSFKAIIKKNTGIETSILSIRQGEIFGTHHIVAASENEIIKIDHFSQSREIFSEGALQAAIWMSKKNKGFYSFEDIN